MYLKSRSSGFTLIELMVVLILVGIVVGIAVPSFTRLIENNRVISATNSTVGLISFARSEAVKRGQAVRINAAGNMMTAVLASDNSVIRQSEVVSGNTTISNGTLTFRANGLTNSAGDVSFTICAGAGPGRTITVSRGGRTSSAEVVCP